MQEYVVKPHLLSSAQCLCVYDSGLVHLSLFIIFNWFLQIVIPKVLLSTAQMEQIDSLSDVNKVKSH